MYFDSCTFLKCLSRGLIATSFPPPFPVSSKARRNRASFSSDFADITETTIRRVPEVIIVKLPELNFSEVVYNAGDVILQQGESGDNMFWIEEGSFSGARNSAKTSAFHFVGIGRRWFLCNIDVS